MTRHLLLAATLWLTSCATATGASPAAPSPTAALPADVFYQRIKNMCGQAFAGRIIANTPASSTPDPFEGKALVMHVRGCGEQELRVPFHVGDDRSRTWVITRTDSGLRLKHDHRHEDGSPDKSTMYGGDTRNAGTEQRQEFPVGAYSVAMFQEHGMTASVTNTWAMEIVPGKTFLYELSRPGGRLFQVEFDLSKPVELPPVPWGAID
jgi:hypothetical protein